MKAARAPRLAHALVLLVSWLAASSASASPDTFLVGNGQDGALTVMTPGRVVNTYVSVSADVAIGATSVNVATTAGFSVGDLVMVWQPARLASPASDDAEAPIRLHGAQAGRFELARIQSVTPTRINIIGAMVRSYVAGATQVVRVPEHTTVTVSAAGSITAAPWNPVNATAAVVLSLTGGERRSAIDASGAGIAARRRARGSTRPHHRLAQSARSSAHGREHRHERVRRGGHGPQQHGQRRWRRRVHQRWGGGEAATAGTGGRGGRSQDAGHGRPVVGGSASRLRIDLARRHLTLGGAVVQAMTVTTARAPVRPAAA